MFKKLTIELSDGGAPAAGVKVAVSGCAELDTSNAGSAFFLVEESSVSVTIAGVNVHTVSLDALPPKLRFEKNGTIWKSV
jgi:hypothetical protein